MARPEIPAAVSPTARDAAGDRSSWSDRRALSDGWIVAILVLCLVAIYLFFYRGTFKNPADEWFMYVQADSLARNLSLDVDQMAYVGEFKGLARFGLGGHLYSKYSVVQAALAVPGLWLARWIPPLGQAPLSLLVNPLLTALTAGVLYLTGRRLDYSRRVAIGAALTFALATGAFVYTKTFASEVTAALCLALAVWATVRFRAGDGFRFALLTGAALGLLIANKQANLVVLPGFVAAYWLLRRWDLRTWLALGAPLLGFALLIVAYNAARFGDPLQTGYTPADGGFTANVALTLPALLISPGRGLLVFSPALILAVAGLPGLWRRRHWLVLLIAAAGLPLAVLFAAWHGWHGGMTVWGPRHWLPLLPLACLPLLEAYHRLFGSASRLARAVAAALLIVSSLIQLGAVSFNYLVYVDEAAATYQMNLLNEDEQLARFSFDVGASPILHQARLLRPRYSDILWLQPAAAGQPRFAAAAFLAALAAVLAAFGAAVAVATGRGRWVGLLAGAGVVVAAGLFLAGSEAGRVTAANADWTAAVRFVERQAVPDTTLVTLGTDPLAVTFSWLKSDIDHIGLTPPLGDDLDPIARRWLDLATMGRREVWVARRAGEGKPFLTELSRTTQAAGAWTFGDVTLERFSVSVAAGSGS